MAVPALVGAALLLGFPSAALAATPPSADTFDASSTGATTATVTGEVNPQGQSTTLQVQYDTAASQWCTSFGSSGSPANSTTAQPLNFSDNGFHEVAVPVTGLTAGTGYCAEIVATNGSGSSPNDDGGQVQWTQGTPTAFTFGAFSTGATTATVDGQVNPAGQSTTYKVVYDTTASQWCTSFGSSGSPGNSTTAQPLAESDSSFHDVSVNLTGLTGGTGYCAEIVATNGTASTPTDDGGQAVWVQGMPFADTFDAFSTGATTATVDGQVNPAGQSTTYDVVYDTAASQWCTSHGTSGSPANSTTAQPLAFSDSNFHHVSVNLTGLTGGTGYCAEVVATNGTGSTATNGGGQVSWMQGTPGAATFDVTSTGAATATVDGEVNPAGQSTTYKVVYDTAASQWCTNHGTSGSPANSTTAQPLAFSDNSFHDVSVSVIGLTAGTNYCAAVVAINGSGTSTGFPVGWTQGTPAAATSHGFSTGAATATVDGQVNPAGQSTTFKVVYDTAASQWCTSSGASGSPANSTTAQPLSFSDSSFHSVSVDLTGLTAGTGYCAEVVATNATGSTPTNDGDQAGWMQGTPGAHTLDAFSTGAATATVEGEVNPAGQSTTYKVVYDSAASQWCTSFGSSGSPASSTTAQSLAFTDSSFHDVSVSVTGLTAGTNYCAEIVATNGSGSTPTDDGGQAEWTQGTPAADTFDVSSTGVATATVDGEVNPAGQSTTYKVVYDTAASQWCTSFGSSGTPANSTTAQPLGFSDNSFHDVSANLTGLTAGTSYCAAVVATNGTGTSTGFPVPWTQGEPGAVTDDAVSTGTTTATVDGHVNPAGQSTTYKVVYDTAGSQWCTSFGSSGSPANSTTAQPLGFSDGSFHSVSVNLAGLTAGTGYCAEVVATNATGSTPTDDGDQVTWTQSSGTPQHTLTVSKAGSGAGSVTSSPAGINCGSTCSSSFTAGSQVTLTASASAGSVFAGWSGGGCSGTGTCVVTLSSDTAVSATFNQAPPSTHTLTVSKAGSGSGGVTSSPAGINCGSTCSSSFTAGSQVTLTASAAAGSVFAGWSGGGCSGTGTCVVTLSSDTAVSATFNQAPPSTHTLTVSKAGSGSGGVTSSPAGIDCGSTCSNSFAAGSQVTLTATASAGSVFAGWSGGGCSGTGTCVVTLSSDASVTASFTATPPPPPPPPPATKCVVPKLTGKTLAAAKKAIKKAHCGVGKITTVKSSKKNKGRVISQSPKAGKRLKAGSKVSLKAGK